MTRNPYNGWTNYETWVVKLWMDNNEGDYNYWRDRADECLGCYRQAEKAIEALAKDLKQLHDEALPKVEGFAADLMNAAMSEVNWYEIAESLLDEAKERVAA